MVVLPAAGFSVISTMYFFGSTIINFINSIILKIEEITTIGLVLPHFNLDFFYFNTDVVVFVSAIAVLGTLFIIMTSRGLAEEDGKFGLDSLMFLLLYTLIAPIWMTKAIYNVIFVKETKWR
jgi:hypothetical protein